MSTDERQDRRTPRARAGDVLRGLIERAVADLNDALGLTAAEHRVTFGYLGNDGDRMWYVFLPHPGRPGTPEDRIGGFTTGDAHRARATLTAVEGAVKGARLARLAR